MSTFDALTSGTSLAAVKVRNFFRDVQRKAISTLPVHIHLRLDTTSTSHTTTTGNRNLTQIDDGKANVPTSSTPHAGSGVLTPMPLPSTPLPLVPSAAAPVPLNASANASFSSSQGALDSTLPRESLQLVNVPTTISASSTTLPPMNPHLDPSSSVIVNDPASSLPNYIVVAHLLPTLPAYLRGLRMSGRIHVILLKGDALNRSDHMQKMYDWVSDKDGTGMADADRFEFREAVKRGKEVNKDELRKRGKIDEVLKKWAIEARNAQSQNRTPSIAMASCVKFILLDIGGYFAPCLEELTMVTHTPSQPVRSNTVPQPRTASSGTDTISEAGTEIKHPSRSATEVVPPSTSRSVQAAPSQSDVEIRIVGIVEDTENGHQKYVKALSDYEALHSSEKPSERRARLPPVYSVARSLMKQTEDYNVGKSLVRATDTLLREHLDLRLEDEPRIGVLGFGKIGSSIARHLQQMNIGTVHVCDTNPSIAIRAASQDFVLCDKQQMLADHAVSIIFAATGNKCLNFRDLTTSRASILIISSCTSSDDELDVHTGLNDASLGAKLKKREPAFTEYELIRDDGQPLQLFLLCNGNAPNFFCRAVLGEYIRAVQAAMMVCALKLRAMDAARAPAPSFYPVDPHVTLKPRELDEEEERAISTTWLDSFTIVKNRGITNIILPDVTLPAVNPEEDGLSSYDTDALKELLIKPPDDQRLLLLCGPAGCGKSEVVAHVVRQPEIFSRYDLVWWLDAAEPMGGLLQLAHRLNRPKIFSAVSQLSSDVFEHIMAATNIQHVLLIIDNVQASPHATAGLTIGSTSCHPVLLTLSKALDQSRRQRRMHIVALAGKPSANVRVMDTAPSTTTWDTQKDTNGKIWRTRELPSHDKSTAKTAMKSVLDEAATDEHRTFAERIYLNDSRRLTLLLARKLIIQSRSERQPNAQTLDTTVNKTGTAPPNYLNELIKLVLGSCLPLGQQRAAAAAAWLNSNSINTVVMNKVTRSVLTADGSPSPKKSSPDYTNSANTIRETLASWHILRRSAVSDDRVTRLVAEPVFHMPSSFVNGVFELMRGQPDLQNNSMRSALMICRDGFNYDYHSNEQFHFKHKVASAHFTSYLDHTLSVLNRVKRETDRLDPKTQINTSTISNDPVVPLLHCRLALYYVNEHRDYGRAQDHVDQANTIINLRDSKLDPNDPSNREWCILAGVALLYDVICNELIQKEKGVSDEQVKKWLLKVTESDGKFRNALDKNEQSSQGKHFDPELFQLECKITELKLLLRLPPITYHESAIVARDNLATACKNYCQPDLPSEAQFQTETGIHTGTIGSAGAIPPANRDLPHRLNALRMQLEGRLFLQRKMFESAFSKFEAAENDLRRVFGGQQHPDIARVLYLQARAVINDKPSRVKDIANLHRAYDLCNNAFRMQESVLPHSHRNKDDTTKLRKEISERIQQLESEAADEEEKLLQSGSSSITMASPSGSSYLSPTATSRPYGRSTTPSEQTSQMRDRVFGWQRNQDSLAQSAPMDTDGSQSVSQFEEASVVSAHAASSSSQQLGARRRRGTEDAGEGDSRPFTRQRRNEAEGDSSGRPPASQSSNDSPDA